MSNPSPPPPQEQLSITSLYKILQTNTHNIGKALTCPICQSSYTNPVLLPCVHAYCRDCITQALQHSNKCPTCKLPSSKRSLVESSLLQDLVTCYKQVVKNVGMAPITYDEEFVGMTQNPLSTSLPEEEECQLHYQVSKTWQNVLDKDQEQEVVGNKVLRQQQAAIVAVDQRALKLQHGGVESDEEDDRKLAAVESTKSQEKVKNPSQDEEMQEDALSRQGSSSNVDSQGNPFVDAKSYDDGNSSVASDETTLDHEESIQNVTTILANQRLILATPAAALKDTQEDTTCPRDNTTIVNKSTSLNDLVPKATTSPHPTAMAATSSPPTTKTDSQQSLARQYSESQAFYTAESEAEDTQEGDDASLTAAAKDSNKATTDGGTTSKDATIEESLSSNDQEDEPMETETLVPKEVTVEQPQAESSNDINEPSKSSAVEETLEVDGERTSSASPPEDTSARTQDEDQSTLDDVADKEEASTVLDDTKAPSERQEAPKTKANEKSPETQVRADEDEPMPDAEGQEEEEEEEEGAPVSSHRETAYVPSEAVLEEPSTGRREQARLESEPASGSTERYIQPNAPEAAPQSPPLQPHDTAAQDDDDDDEPMPDVDNEEEPIMPEAETLEEPQEDLAESTPPSEDAFAIGTIVQVQDRTWPGINKQGGVGRITKIHRDGSTISYDVSYVLGGREKKVEAVFVSEQEPEQKRNRSPKPVEKEKLSPELLASLAADGFDTEGKVGLETLRRVGVKAGTKRKALLDANKSDEPAVHGRKKRQKGKTAETKTTRKRKQQGAKPTSLPVLSDEQKREMADARYQKRFQSAESQSVISVVASSLSEHDMTMLQLLCKETKNKNVKVRMTETFNANKTTLVVAALDAQSTPENATSRNRTLKIMRAMLAGIPIVSPSWVSSCLNNGSVTTPTADEYIRTVPVKTSDPLVNADLGASLLAARIHQAEGQGNARLLSNVRVLLCGQFKTSEGSPRKADIQVLLRESGATISPSVGEAMNKLKKVGNDDDAKKIVLLCDECPRNDRCGISAGLAKEVKAALERDGDGVVVVSSTWLFDSISCGDMAPFKPFKPQSARASELWRLCWE